MLRKNLNKPLIANQQGMRNSLTEIKWSEFEVRANLELLSMSP